jgi:ferric-dicitrate binding protein FerR (iron transport regulator)
MKQLEVRSACLGLAAKVTGPDHREKLRGAEINAATLAEPPRGFLREREMSTLGVVLRLIAIGLLFILPRAAAAAETVGTVTRVENQARIGGVNAVVGTPVHMDDEIRTGPKGRLEVTFRDQTLLTLGENAKVAIDRYVYSPSQGTGEMAVKATQGAMRFVTGKIGKLKDHNVTVVTPQAALAVRGTDFWVGPIDGKYGVLLLKGKVKVSGN